jgi:hypothetical protein
MSIDGDLPMKSLRRPTRVERHLFAILVASVAIFGDVRTANGGIVAIWVNDTVTGWQQMAVDPTGEIAAVGSYTTLNGAFNLTNSYAAMTDGPNADINSSTFHLQHIGNGSDSLAIAGDWDELHFANQGANLCTKPGKRHQQPRLLDSPYFPELC